MVYLQLFADQHAAVPIFRADKNYFDYQLMGPGLLCESCFVILNSGYQVEAVEYIDSDFDVAFDTDWNIHSVNY